MNRKQRRAAGKQAGPRMRAPSPAVPEVMAEAVRLHQAGRLAEAEQRYRQVLEIQPDHAECLHLLGVIAYQGGRLDAASDRIGKAIAVRPDFPEAYSNLGNVLKQQGRLDDAIACYRKAVALKPGFADAHNNLGNALMGRGQFDAAIACYRKAVELNPGYAEPLNNLAAALKDQGRLDEAIACYRRALALKPDYWEAYSNLILTLHYAERLPEGEFLRTVRAYADLMQRTPARQTFANTPVADRRLRIGYVSGDLRAHPVGYFLINVLRAHDHSAVEVVCYSNFARGDGVTADLRAAADHWRVIAGKPDAEVDALIRQDEIDILVDLSGHTANNRLTVFAGRAAPVQATWLGYFGTTGLGAMDYVVADRFVIPPAEDAQFTESVWRLPDSYLCFAPPDLDVPIGARPSGELVLGCFNNWAKVSESTVTLWARILSEIPGSRLLLKTKGLDNPGIRREAAERFARHGIAADRLVMEGPSLRAELLAAYNRIDIALDPFPYGGGTTTAEALWMGVPVVTLRGDRWVGRVSESILTTVGLPGLVAADTAAYSATVRRLADDRAQRDGLRRSLRATMEASPLCDGPRFAASLEAGYRTMWRNWCGRQAQ